MSWEGYWQVEAEREVEVGRVVKVKRDVEVRREVEVCWKESGKKEGHIKYNRTS